MFEKEDGVGTALPVSAVACFKSAFALMSHSLYVSQHSLYQVSIRFTVSIALPSAFALPSSKDFLTFITGPFPLNNKFFHRIHHYNYYCIVAKTHQRPLNSCGVRLYFTWSSSLLLALLQSKAL